MFKYSEDNGKKARVWGSLSTIKGDVEVKAYPRTASIVREIEPVGTPGWPISRRCTSSAST